MNMLRNPKHPTAARTAEGYATPVEAADSLAHRRMRSQAAGGPRPEPFDLAVVAGARRPSRSTTAILVTGADGQFVSIEPLAEGELPAGQLAARAKRLFKGQRAQLISFNVILEA